MKESRAKHLSDLWSYGNSWLYLFTIMAIGALAGGLLGWTIGAPGDGAAIGIALGLLAWLGMVIAAHRQLSPYRGEHREPAHPPAEHDA